MNDWKLYITNMIVLCFVIVHSCFLVKTSSKYISFKLILQIQFYD